jgi:hypothetical protein
VAVALSVLLIVAAATVAFRVRGDDHTHGPAARSAVATSAPLAPASPSAGAARYVRPFDFCTLLSPAQVEELIPGAKKFPPGDAHSCDWGVAARHQALSVTAEHIYDPATGASAQDPWTAPPAAARVSYERQRAVDRKARTGIAWGWEEIGVRSTGARRSAARPVSGVGEDAYTTETFRGRAMERADVVLRDSNLYLRIWFVAAGGTADAARIRQDALRAARWISAALRRTP